jgi:hypothetical protein
MLCFSSLTSPTHKINRKPRGPDGADWPKRACRAPNPDRRGEYFLADDLRQILSDQRAEVLGPVATIANALSVISNTGPIDCAVLDINLGGEAAFPISMH